MGKQMWVGFLILILLLLAVSPLVTYATPAAAPKMVVQPAEYDFGDLAGGQVYTHNFVLQNTGGRDLVIGHIYASCGCSKVRLASRRIKPGAKTNLLVFLDTTGKADGIFSGELEIESNDPNEPKQVVRLKANITNKLGKAPKAENPVGKISAQTFKRELENQPGLVLVDVRTPQEYQAGHLPGSILIPLDRLKAEAEIQFATYDTLIVVYCQAGVRSQQAARELVKLGYTMVYDLGGICDWPYEVER